jgi:hypothetical protein
VGFTLTLLQRRLTIRPHERHFSATCLTSPAAALLTLAPSAVKRFRRYDPCPRIRSDRHPPPIRHYHGPVALGNGVTVNHSEIAIVLPRTRYDLPEVAGADEGQIVIYRRPAEDPADILTLPVRPGSIVVTPATPATSMGHCFENCFAMLVAIPGFVAPYTMIEE